MNLIRLILLIFRKLQAAFLLDGLSDRSLITVVVTDQDYFQTQRTDKTSMTLPKHPQLQPTPPITVIQDHPKLSLVQELLPDPLPQQEGPLRGEGASLLHGRLPKRFQGSTRGPWGSYPVHVAAVSGLLHNHHHG